MGKTKILIVEDEAIIAKDMQLRLEHMGYDIPMIAASGEDAILKALDGKPDLILMDIFLIGKMDGIEAAQQIHLKDNIPVIYLTSYEDASIMDRAKTTNPCAYLIKPVSDRDLQDSIESSLKKE